MPIYRPDNFGNLAMRRAFLERDGAWLRHIEEVCEVLNLEEQSAHTTAYKMCSPIGRFGSGRPSPFHHANELIRRRHELDIEERRVVPLARELAYSTVEFYLALVGERDATFDTIAGLKRLFSRFAEANLIAADKPLDALSTEQTQKVIEHVTDVRAVADQIVVAARASLREKEAAFTGAPVHRENGRREQTAQGRRPTSGGTTSCAP
ncbi:MAG TPA: hypothetical protein VIP46_07900, partial [Pyrinomonadaceae bacterium]